MSRDRAGELVAGKYRLDSRLGSGGMAEVWSATNRFTERRVAVKLLDREMGGVSDATTRFLNEAKVTARVDHPNIVEVIDVGQADDGQLFLVMELLFGTTLETALREQVPPMTAIELTRVMIEVASALEAAHAAGIVHRDLKPANVFLHRAKHGVVPKVLDFGVSKFRGETEPSITIAGTVLGSPLYMSPEQARGETEVDGRTDVFAFGGILFEALTGYRAFEAKNFNALIVKIATSRPKEIDAEAPHLPASLRKVVRACLEPDLARRAKGFGEVLPLLRAALPDLAAAPRSLPSAIAASSVFDPDGKRTAYEAALAPREPPRASAWWPIACGAIVIAGLAVFAERPAPSFIAPPPAATTVKPALEIVASPGSCEITIDGVARGPTPVHAGDLAPGEHAITCRPATGALRTTKVVAGPGGPMRYRFLLE